MPSMVHCLILSWYLNFDFILYWKLSPNFVSNIKQLLANLIPHSSHQKIYGFLMILGGIEVNWSALFQSILRANFDNNP